MKLNIGVLWFPMLYFTPIDTEICPGGHYHHSLSAVAPVNSADPDIGTPATVGALITTENAERKQPPGRASCGVFLPLMLSEQVLLLRGCLACIFPLFLQLCSLVGCLLCSSKGEMWGESTLSEIGMQMSAGNRGGKMETWVGKQ